MHVWTQLKCGSRQSSVLSLKTIGVRWVVYLEMQQSGRHRINLVTRVTIVNKIRKEQYHGLN